MKRNETKLSSEEFPDERSEVVSSLGKIYELMLEMPSDKADGERQGRQRIVAFLLRAEHSRRFIQPSLRPCDAISRNSSRYNDTTITSAHPLMFTLKHKRCLGEKRKKVLSRKVD